MQLDDFLSEMGYHGSPNFLSGEALSNDPDNGYVYRKAVNRCSLQGAYVLRPPSDDGGTATVPIVYVCETQTDADARAIHKKVWNQGIVPFLVILGPNSIRLYSGFKYQKDPSSLDEDANEGLLRPAIQFNAITRELRAFRAESIDDGTVWLEWGSKASPEDRVDWRLLRNLDQLDKWLMSDGVPDRSTRHALIGKCVYVQYLRARDILSDRKLAEWGVEWDEFFSREARISIFRMVLGKVKEWLNGSVFPLSDAAITKVGQQRLREVVGTFRGDSPGGQLHLDFEAYDFSFIPIETLSVIYEQFLHSADSETEESKGKARGAYYTPLPLVGFVIDRLNQIKPLKAGARVLDLACGSGAFLVHCYRRLIEQHSRHVEETIRPVQLRQLLTDHIFGIDSDADACQLAELSLIMTLLDYVEPPDLKSNPTFQLPELEGKNIIRGDAFDANCIRALGMDREKPTWIVGNPPWKELKERSLDTSERNAFEWIGTHKQDLPTGGNQIAEAFAWLSRNIVGEGGAVGLVMPAMTLSKYESRGFRRQFFRRSRVLAVANFSNLAEVLFSGRSRAAAAVFFFSPLSPEAGEWPETVEVYSPLVVNEITNRKHGRRRVRGKKWNITVNASEIRDVHYSDILDGEPLPWRLAGWGSAKDKKLLSSAIARFPTLRNFEQDDQVFVSEGMQLRKGSKRPVAEELTHHPELAGQLVLQVERLRRKKYLFHFPSDSLATVAEDLAYVRKGRFERPFEVCHPPHIIVGAARTFAIYSDRFVVVPARQIGISRNKCSAEFLKALSLYLNSDFAKYHQVLTFPQFGVKREVSTLRALKSLPVPFLPEHDLGPWSKLHSKLVETSMQLSGPEVLLPLLGQLNDLTNLALGLDDRGMTIVRDFVDVRMSLLDGKIGTSAARKPTGLELQAYAARLKSDLDGFLGEASSDRHSVRIVHNSDFGMVQIDLNPNRHADPEIQVLAATNQMARELQSMRLLLRERQSQWMYFNRNLRIYQGTTTYIAKPMQRLQWLESQAMLDASEIIAETLDPTFSNKGSESSRAYGQFR